MSRAYRKDPNDRKAQATIFSPKPTSPVGMFANEDYLGEPKTQKLEVINFIKIVKEFKEDPKKQLNEIKQKEFKEDKCQSDSQENNNRRLMEMMNTIQALKMEFVKRQKH